MGHGPVVGHDAVFSGPQSFSTINSKLHVKLFFLCLGETYNRTLPFLTNLVGHEQKKVENPWSRPSLHNSNSSKGQVIKMNLQRAAKVYFISMWRFRCNMEEIIERQLLFEVELSQHFLQLRKVSRAACGQILCRPGLDSRWRSAFPWLHFVGQTLFSFSFLSSALRAHRSLEGS